MSYGPPENIRESGTLDGGAHPVHREGGRKKVEGSAVWGTRCRWMKLSSEIKGEQIAVVIIDHPSNVGYPTYWHARGYGLFAANTLGQSIFSKGKEELNFSIDKGKSATFRYRLAVFSGEPTVKELEKMAKDFAGKI